MELIQLNRDPELSDFSKEDFVLNTITGDLFAKTDTKLFKVVSRNQFDQSTTDALLRLIAEASDIDNDNLAQACVVNVHVLPLEGEGGDEDGEGDLLDEFERDEEDGDDGSGSDWDSDEQDFSSKPKTVKLKNKLRDFASEQ